MKTMKTTGSIVPMTPASPFHWLEVNDPDFRPNVGTLVHNDKLALYKIRGCGVSGGTDLPQMRLSALMLPITEMKLPSLASLVSEGSTSSTAASVIGSVFVYSKPPRLKPLSFEDAMEKVLTERAELFRRLA